VADPDSATVDVTPADRAAATDVARRRNRRWQWLGGALVIYGVIGIVIFALVAYGINRPLQRAGELTQAVDEDMAALVDLLDETETTLRGMSTTVSHVDDSLASAQAAVARSSDIALGLSAAMYGLRDAVGITIFGQQPLIGLASRFDQAAQQLQLLSADLATISTALGVNRADVATTATSLQTLADRVATLSDTIDETPDVAISQSTLSQVRLGIYAVVGWLMLLAVGCVIVGVYLISYGRRQPAAV
jgi:methyl-accepting chemotaxis protein